MRHSIRTRLTIAFVALAIGPLLLVGAVLAWQSFTTQEQQALNLQQEVAQRVTAQVTAFFDELENQLRVVTRIQGFQQLDRGQQQDTLGELLAYQNAFDELILLDSQGQEQIHLARLGSVASDLGTRSEADEFVLPSTSGEVYYGPVRFQETTGEPLMTVAVPLFDARSGLVDGVLVSEVRIKRIWDLIANIRVSPGQSVYIVDAQAVVVAHRNPSVVLRSTTFAVPSQDGVQPGLTGARSVLAVATTRFGEQEFNVVVEQEWSEALAQAFNSMIIIGLIMVATLGVSGGLGFLSVRQIVRPIQALAATAQSISAGDLTAQARVTSRDEIGTLATTFNSMTAQLRSLIGSLESQVDARTEQLRASVDVGRAAASILDQTLLMSEVVSLITDRFGFYYAAIFTPDANGRYAVLREATGEAGLILKERGHQLEVGGESMVGTVVATRQPRIALDVGEEPVRFANPLLPATRSEIALPLAVGERVLGALDVQSTQEAAFDETSVAVLQSMADQVAVALANAQSFETVQSALRQTTRLYELSRSLFDATSPQAAYTAILERGVRLPGLDRTGIMLVTARDVGGDPLEYEMAAQWDVEDGIRLGSDKRYALTDLPLVNLLDRESIVVVHDADDPHVPETTRHIMEQAGTKAVVIVPLIIRGQYDGFLAAACRQPLEFSEGEINFLRAAAEQLSIVLSGLRSAEETSAALDRIAQLNRRMSGEAWRGYLVARRDMTVESGRLPASDDVSRLSVPIVVRGETLGVMDLEDANGQRQWSDEEWDLLNVVAGEVAQAVENARLIEQTQQRAAREAELNRIAAKIRQAGDIDTILRIAAEELSQSLRASHANARLGGLPDEAGRRDGH